MSVDVGGVETFVHWLPTAFHFSTVEPGATPSTTKSLVSVPASSDSANTIG